MSAHAHNNDDRERVLHATDIVDLVGGVCDLKPAGREYKCVCPFHDDHNPSMYVVPAKQIYHCFVCGAGGNAIDFVINYHNLGFREALQMLADRAGIELTPWKPQAGATDRTGASREELAKAHEFAHGFFRAIFAHPEHGALAREAAAKRGISEEMLERFQVGAAPDRFDGLLKTIGAKDQVEQVFADGGLLRTKDSGHRYDVFRNRLMFPILDQLGRPIAFGGRILDPEDTPKYLNSPEHGLFDKSSTLFGIYQAFQSIRETRHAILTEGYTDVIACHQHGFTNAVATLGTAFTAKHLAQLRRSVDRLTLLFDGDEAGLRAADRAAERAAFEPLDVRIAVLPGGADPDDVLKQEGGVEAFQRVLDEAVDVLTYRIDRLRQRLDAEGLEPDAPRRIAAIEADLAQLASLGAGDLSPMRRQGLAKRYARLAGVDAGVALEVLQSGGGRRRVEEEPEHAGPRPSTSTEHLLACVLAEPKLALPDVTDGAGGRTVSDRSPLLEEVEAALVRGAYNSDNARRAATLAVDGLRSGDAETAVLLTRTEDHAVASLITAFASAAHIESGGDSGRLERRFRDSVRACIRDASPTQGADDRRDTQPGEASHDGPDSSNERGDKPGGPGRTRRVEDALRAARQQHQAAGGNPLAVPKPRFGG